MGLQNSSSTNQESGFLFSWFVKLCRDIWNSFYEAKLNIYTDREVMNKYVDSGFELGRQIELLRIVCNRQQFESTLSTLVYWEAEFARRGYKPVMIEDFVSYAKGKSLCDLYGNRDKLAKYKLYAKEYKDKLTQLSSDNYIDDSLPEDLPAYFVTQPDIVTPGDEFKN